MKISMSLNVADDALFKEDIIDLKESRELTSLISKLLEGYFSDDNIRESYDDYFSKKDPLLLVQKDLERIASLHSNNRLMQEAIKGEYESLKRNVESNVSNKHSILETGIKSDIDSITTTKSISNFKNNDIDSESQVLKKEKPKSFNTLLNSIS